MERLVMLVLLVSALAAGIEDTTIDTTTDATTDATADTLQEDAVETQPLLAPTVYDASSMNCYEEEFPVNTNSSLAGVCSMMRAPSVDHWFTGFDVDQWRRPRMRPSDGAYNDESRILMKFSLGDTAFEFRTDVIGALTLITNERIEPLNLLLAMDKWTNFCFVHDRLLNYFHLYINGREHIKRRFIFKKRKSTDSNGSYNNSTVADVKIVHSQSEDTKEQMFPFASFCTARDDGWIQVLMKRIGYFKSEYISELCSIEEENSNEIYSEWVSPHHMSEGYDPCIDQFSFIRHKEPLIYTELKANCMQMQGTLLTESDVTDSDAQKQALAASCTTDDEIASWMNQEEESEGGEASDWCPVFLSNGSTDVRSCLQTLDCGICKVPTYMKINIFGKINKFDHNYTMHINTNGSYFFKGGKSSLVEYISGQWILQSNLHDKKCSATETPSPFVRREWECERNLLNLTFSSCGHREYACNSGSCIRERYRCDGKTHCDDKSDEQDCRFIETDIGYDVEHEPPPLTEESRVVLNYIVWVKSIDDVETSNKYIDATFTINFYWRDPRLTIWNIFRMFKRISCESIWTPSFSTYQSTEQNNYISWPDTISSSCSMPYCRRSVNQARDDYLMGSYVDGSQCGILLQLDGPIRIPCQFDLRKYPFGKQQCQICFVPDRRTNTIGFKEQLDNVVYDSGFGRPAGDYFFEKATVVTHDKNKTLCVTIHLKSFFSYHLLNSYFTSFLILIISYSTFVFRVEDFNERVMVGLTALLVLTGLFAQANDSAFNTQYLKLLDIWYAAIICFSFLVTIAHGLLNFIQHKMNARKKILEGDDGTRDTRKFLILWNRIVFGVLIGGFLVFLFFYILAATEVI